MHSLADWRMEFTNCEMYGGNAICFPRDRRDVHVRIMVTYYHEAIDFNAPRLLILKNKMEVSSQWHMLRFKDNPWTLSCESVPFTNV
jgi:hypothetical protein